MNQEQPRIAVVHKSLIRPQTMFGSDRILVFVLLMAAGLLIGPGGMGSGSIANIVLGVVILLVGIQLLAALAKYDPDAREVFRRSMRFKEVYSASSGVRVRDKR